MDLSHSLLIGAAVLITGISKGGFSGAFGIIAVPLISLTTSPITAAAIMLPILCIMDLFTIQKFWRKWDIKAVQSSIPAAIVGVVIASLIASWVSEALLKLLVGSVAIGFTLNAWHAKYKQRKSSPLGVAASNFWCALGGFTSFIAHAGGPPISVYLLRLNLDKTAYVASAAFIFTAINYVKIIPYAFLGQFNTAVLWQSFLFIPVAFIGVQLGAWMHYKVDPKLFFKILYIFLFITGVKLIWDGASALF